VAAIQEASLVLTVLNEASGLPRFLESLKAQSILPSEIVIVDGGSTDGTPDILRNWDAPPGCVVSVLDRPGANISKGRNYAIEKARHARILVTDAGTTLDEHWARNLLLAFSSTESPDVVSGFFSPTGEHTWEKSIAFAVTPELSEIDAETFLPSSRSVGFTKDAWNRAGGYPEWLDYCEDLLFDLRLKDIGSKFKFVPSAVVTWSARSSLSAFMKQYYRYARGDGKAALWGKRHLARYLAYAIGAGLLIAVFAQPWTIVVLVPLAGFYLSKFWRRVSTRLTFGDGLAAAVLLVPVIVVAGDLAKMAGYPAGVLWRRRNSKILGSL